MASQNLGRVGLVPKGDWSSSTSYVKLDLVSHDGNAWAAKNANTNSEPNTTNPDWQLISNNTSLVATVQGYKNDAQTAASAAALSAATAQAAADAVAAVNIATLAETKQYLGIS